MFPHQNPVYTSSVPIRIICPAHLILLDLTTGTLFVMEYRILEVNYLNKESGGLCQFFQIPGDVLSVPSNKRINKIKRCQLRK
jgi:hypothetical protein